MVCYFKQKQQPHYFQQIKNYSGQNDIILNTCSSHLELLSSLSYIFAQIGLQPWPRPIPISLTIYLTIYMGTYFILQSSSCTLSLHLNMSLPRRANAKQMWDHWTSRSDPGLGLYSFDYLILLCEKFLNDFRILSSFHTQFLRYKYL